MKKTTKEDAQVRVRCPRCHCNYYRVKADLGKKERCGVCVKMVVLEKIK